MLKTRIPPPLYMLAAGYAMDKTDHYLVLPIDPAIAQWGWLPALLGGVLLVWAGVTFWRAHTTINPLVPSKASHLVTHGPFRWTRNPMYLALALMLAGWALWLGNAVSFLGVPVFVLVVTVLQIVPEERVLQEHFGEEYMRYRDRVNRWFGPLKGAWSTRGF